MNYKRHIVFYFNNGDHFLISDIRPVGNKRLTINIIKSISKKKITFTSTPFISISGRKIVEFDMDIKELILNYDYIVNFLK